MSANKDKAAKIIIDTDPGIDDAMAVHLAFADARLELLALTSIFGNVFTDQATRNALALVEQAGSRIPVAAGALHPRTQTPNIPSHYVHGKEGLGALPAPTPKAQPDPREAAHLLSEMCRQQSGEIILCPVGPLTNIAALLDADPDIAAHVKKLVIMGGAVWCPGNVTQVAEANIWNDPHAADRVFAADWDIDLIGLDVTQKVTCVQADFEGLRQTSPEIGGFLADITSFYIDFYHSVVGQHICMMHDPSAVIAITDRDAFEFRQAPLRVICEGEEIGQTVAETQSGRRPVNVAVGVDSARVRKIFLDICAQADTIRNKRIAAT